MYANVAYSVEYANFTLLIL